MSLKRAAIALILLLAFDSKASSQSPSANAARLLYSTHCVDCHETDGRGAEYRSAGISIPDFASPTWMKTKSTTELRLSILLGKGSEMPPFGNEMSKSEASAMVGYIQSLAGIKARPSGTSTFTISSERQDLDREWERLRAEWYRVFRGFDSGPVGLPLPEHDLQEVR